MKADAIAYPIYNYSDIFSEYFFHDEEEQDRTCPGHVLVFVISGELTVHCKCNKTTLNKGEYIFLREDTDTLLERKASGDEPFRSVFMGLNQCFLKKLYQVIDKKKILPGTEDFADNIITLPKKPYLESLYISLLPYMQWDVCPMKQVLEIKLREAVYSLILTDKRFYSCLFDFNKLEKDGCEIEYTSCDQFKLSACYMIQKMESSYIMKQNRGEVTDVYLDVTYKNAARFLNAFGQGLIFPSTN